MAYAQNLCKTNGVTNLPSAVSCASTISSTSPATASSSAIVATTSGNGTTVKTTSTTSNAAVITSSSASSSSAAAATKTGAAIQNVAGMGAGIIGGLAGLAAALL